MEGHPANCREYCCSEFANLRLDIDDDHPVQDLSYPIDPIFAKFFYQGRPLGAAEYTRLEKTLRLASRLLADDRATYYIVATTEGSIHRLHDIDGPRGPELTDSEIRAMDPTEKLQRYPRSPEGVVTDDMRVKSRVILDNLTDAFRGFHIIDGLSSHGVCLPWKSGSSQASSSLTIRGGRFVPFFTVPDLTGDFARGCRSSIKLGKQFFLPDLPNPMTKSARIMETLGAFEQARVLVHELGHALNFAVDGNRSTEIFYNNCTISESGLDIDAALFGGPVNVNMIHNWTGRAVQGPAIFQDHYPSELLFETWKGINNVSGKSCIGGPRGPFPFGPYSIVTRLSFKWVHQMFNDSFWENDVPKLLPGPLQPVDAPRWTIRVMKPGELFMDSAGTNVVAKGGEIETTTTTDPKVPTAVKAILTDIWEVQQRRRAGSSQSPASRAS